jgi:hypothetical protein
MNDMFTANQQNTAELDRQLENVRESSDAEVSFTEKVCPVRLTFGSLMERIATDQRDSGNEGRLYTICFQRATSSQHAHRGRRAGQDIGSL